MYGRWASSVAGPTVCNSLPEDLQDPDCSVHSYRQSLKTFFIFRVLERSARSRFAMTVCYINSLDTDIDIALCPTFGLLF